MAALKGIVIFMGLLIITLMGLMIYGFYQKAQNPDFKFFQDDAAVTENAAAPRVLAPSPTDEPAHATPRQPRPTAISEVMVFGDIALGLPETAKIVSATATANQLIIVVATDGLNPNLVTVVDLATGVVMGHVKTGQ